MNTIDFSKAELMNARFPSNRSVLIGDNLITYSSSVMMMEELMELAFSTRTRSDTIFGHPIYIATQVEKVDPDPFRDTAKTVEEKFDEALECFIEMRSPYFGETVKIVSDEAPAFLMEVYGLQNALYFALKDAGPYIFKARLTKGNIFAAFTEQLGYWWVADLCGVNAALALARKFFDAYINTITKIG